MATAIISTEIMSVGVDVPDLRLSLKSGTTSAWCLK